MIRPLNSLPRLTTGQKLGVTFGIGLILTALFVIGASSALLADHNISVGKFTFTNVGEQSGLGGLMFAGTAVTLLTSLTLYLFYEDKMEEEIAARAREIELARRAPPIRRYGERAVSHSPSQPQPPPPLPHIQLTSTHTNGNGNGNGTHHPIPSPSPDFDGPPQANGLIAPLNGDAAIPVKGSPQIPQHSLAPLARPILASLVQLPGPGPHLGGALSSYSDPGPDGSPHADPAPGPVGPPRRSPLMRLPVEGLGQPVGASNPTPDSPSTPKTPESNVKVPGCSAKELKNHKFGVPPFALPGPQDTTIHFSRTAVIHARPSDEDGRATGKK